METEEMSSSDGDQDSQEEESKKSTIECKIYGRKNKKKGHGKRSKKGK